MTTTKSISNTATWHITWTIIDALLFGINVYSMFHYSNFFLMFMILAFIMAYRTSYHYNCAKIAMSK